MHACPHMSPRAAPRRSPGRSCTSRGSVSRTCCTGRCGTRTFSTRRAPFPSPRQRFDPSPLTLPPLPAPYHRVAVQVRASVEVEAWKSHLSNAMSQLRTLGQENLLPNPTWPTNHHGGSEAEDFSSITHSGSTRNQQLSRPTSPPTPPPRIQAASAHGADDLSTSQWGLQESFSFATNISHSSPGPLIPLSVADPPPMLAITAMSLNIHHPPPPPFAEPFESERHACATVVHNLPRS